MDKELNLPKLSKKITKLFQRGRPAGRKYALREEKKRRLDANFEYILEKKKPGPKLSLPGIKEEDIGVNNEAIFIELGLMKNQVTDMLRASGSSGYEGLVQHFIGYFSRPQLLINPFDLAAYYSLEFVRPSSDLESNMLKQLSFYGTIFKTASKYPAESEVQNHFPLFLVRLESAKILEQLFDRLLSCRSIHFEIEAFEFFSNTIKASPTFFASVAGHFLSEGDELFYHAKRVFSKPTLQVLADVVYKNSTQTLRLRLCEAYLEFIISFYSLMLDLDHQPGAEAMARVHKVSFHLYRRLGEFIFAVRTFFKSKTTHLYVLKIDQLVARSLLAIFRVSCQALPFQEHHPFLTSLQGQLERPLSLSNNIEDEATTAVYATFVEILALLLDRLGPTACHTLVMSLRLESLLKTAVLVQETSLADVADRLGKNLVCDTCSPSCTFYRCANRRVTKFEKRLSDIGYQLFIILAKTKQLMPEGKIDFGYNVREGKEYRTHLERIKRAIQKQVDRLEGFGKQFQRQMESAYGKNQAKSKNKKPTVVINKEIEAQSSVLNMNREDSVELSRNEAKDNNEADDDKSNLNVSRALLPNLARRPGKLKTGEGSRRRSYSRIEGEQDIASMRSIESLRYVLTIEAPVVDLLKPLEADKLNKDDFDLTDLVDKFASSNHANASAGLPEISHDGKSTSGRQSGPSGQFLVDKLRSVFKRDEAEMLDREHDIYVQKLSAYKVAKAIQFYEENIKTIRLSYSPVAGKDEDFQIIQNTLYYVSPHILKYYSKEVEDEIITKLLTYPPRTRKVMFLKEMNLYMANLVEYQKLYAFKELSWIVWVTELTKAINVAIIFFINLYVLFVLNLHNHDTAGSEPFLYTIMIISCTVAGICSLFNPIQKLFLANTYTSRFNSYKSRVDSEYQDHLAAYDIIEDKQTYIMLSGLYVRILEVLNSQINKRWGKIVVAIFHVDNLLQFVIFLLAILTVTSVDHDLTGNYVSLFLILVRTSTFHKLYTYLSTNLAAVTVFVLLLLCLFYQIGVLYYSTFSNTLDYKEGVSCDSILHCMAFAASFGLLGSSGFTANVQVPSKVSGDDSMYYWRQNVDTVIFVVVSFLTSVLILAFIIQQLSSKRLELSQVRNKIRQQCLVCGISKSSMEQRGIKWKEHIFEEHNFRKMLHFIIYLLDKPEQHCNAFESNLKHKIVSCDAEFFDQLRVENKLSPQPLDDRQKERPSETATSGSLAPAAD